MFKRFPKSLPLFFVLIAALPLSMLGCECWETIFPPDDTTPPLVTLIVSTGPYLVEVSSEEGVEATIPYDGSSNILVFATAYDEGGVKSLLVTNETHGLRCRDRNGEEVGAPQRLKRIFTFDNSLKVPGSTVLDTKFLLEVFDNLNGVCAEGQILSSGWMTFKATAMDYHNNSAETPDLTVEVQ